MAEKVPQKANSPRSDVLSSSLSRPQVRWGLGILAGVSLVGSGAVGIWSSNPWSLLAVAVICLILAFPHFLAEHIELIKAGAFEVRPRWETQAQPPSSAVNIEALLSPEAAPPTNRHDQRLTLAKLRTAGVGLRNEGMRLKPNDLTAWLDRVAKWADATVAAIGYLDSADAEWFCTLDAVPPPRIAIRPINPFHEKTYRELDLMLVKLDTLIVRYAERD